MTCIYYVTDPQCPYCKQGEVVLKKLADAGEIRVHFLLFPFEIHKGAKEQCISVICDGKGIEEFENGYRSENQCPEGMIKVEDTIEFLKDKGLTKADIRMLLDEAYRILMPSGLLCLCGLTTGFTPLTRLVEKLWTVIHRINPALVGGCRPISLIEFLQASRWRIHHHRKISSFGIPSEALVAEKIGAI